MWTFFFVILCCGAAFGQDEGDVVEEHGFLMVAFGGGSAIGFIIVSVLLLLSIAMGALAIEHFVTIQRDKMVPPEVVVELETLLDEEQYEEAINLCEASKNYITNIVGSAIARVGEGYESMSDAAENATEEENLKLLQKISWLGLIGNVAPMIGLLGTVLGMVVAFKDIAQSATQPTPAELAGGIYVALVTTIWGLVAAIPALSLFFTFKMKVQRLSFELSAVAMEIVERFKPVSQGGK
jgi:biopolymer transport protein ExbB